MRLTSDSDARAFAGHVAGGAFDAPDAGFLLVAQALVIEQHFGRAEDDRHRLRQHDQRPGQA
jgi:hypothetical protein